MATIPREFEDLLTDIEDDEPDYRLPDEAGGQQICESCGQRRSSTVMVGKQCGWCRSRARKAQRGTAKPTWRVDKHEGWLRDQDDPAKHLRDVLADARRSGVEFWTAWHDGVEFVLSCVRTARSREEWSTAFHATRFVWWRGYERQDVAKTPLTVDVIPD